MNPDAVLQIVLTALGVAGGGVAVYAAIRSDIAALHARVQRLESSTDQAHSRIDGLLTFHQQRQS